MSATQVKRYNVSITGRVQDVRFRSLIEGVANIHGLRGYVFNDLDGSVKVVCEGGKTAVEKFLQEIDVKEAPTGISVTRIEKSEVPLDSFLPPRFARLETDVLADIGRKLDK